MDWLTEHFDVLLPIAVVLFFVLQRFLSGQEAEPGSEMEGDEEARRIQEEIRRKIVARQQGRVEEGHQGGMADEERQEWERPVVFPRREESPPPIRNEWERPAPAPQRPPPVRKPEPKPKPKPAARRRDLQDELRIQRERLREAQRAKADAVRSSSRRGLAEERSAAMTDARSGDLRSQLLEDLATGESMKRAFLLKEIVDRPIGLRDRPDSFSNWS